MEISRLTIEILKYKQSKVVYVGKIDGIDVKEIILKEYQEKGKEIPLLGIFIGGFNRTLLTYSQEGDFEKRNAIKKEIEEDYMELYSAKGRIRLIVCEECKDVSCGLISINAKESGTQIIWDSFAYQQNLIDLEDIESLKGLRFVFDKEEYKKEVERAKELILGEF